MKRSPRLGLLPLLSLIAVVVRCSLNCKSSGEYAQSGDCSRIAEAAPGEDLRIAIIGAGMAGIPVQP